MNKAIVSSERRPRPRGQGFFEITLRAPANQKIVNSNNERALVISVMQDLLGVRSFFKDTEMHIPLATYIDMLAFSVMTNDIKFVIFSITGSAARIFADAVAMKLIEYQQDWRFGSNFIPPGTKLVEPKIYIRRLVGQYEALNKTVDLHTRHPDWEYDRYSSVGFYLHDRRGDWMHIWRMSRLYENETNNYRRLLENQRTDIACVMAAPSASAQSSGFGTDLSPI